FHMDPRDPRNPSKNKPDTLTRRTGSGGCTSITLLALAVTVLFAACDPNSHPKPNPLPRMPPIKPIPNPDREPDQPANPRTRSGETADLSVCVIGWGGRGVNT